jgi:hypothetical protein
MTRILSRTKLDIHAIILRHPKHESANLLEVQTHSCHSKKHQQQQQANKTKHSICSIGTTHGFNTDQAVFYLLNQILLSTTFQNIVSYIINKNSHYQIHNHVCSSISHFV